MPALRNAQGVVIGACDSVPFDRLGRRPWRHRERPAPQAATVTDTNVEIDGPRMQDVIKGYTRLK
jgi:hypothetical protein